MISRRTRRVHRRLKRGSGPAQIILTSLIDIFTVLLFFLLIHAANVDVLPEPRELKLPESLSQEKARESVVVMVTPQDIWIGTQRIAGVADVMQSDAEEIPALQSALEQQPLPKADTADADATTAPVRKVTVMGDKGIPYRLLRKVLESCKRAGYGEISLAVMRREADS
jgi:biopolymer transport protein ExbD